MLEHDNRDVKETRSDESVASFTSPLLVALVIGVGAGFAAHSLTSSTSAAKVRDEVPVRTTAISSHASSTDSLTQVYAKDAPGS